ncbi:hypothetical protein HT031_002819 [Scenedesmus sp. PABB004]|nr:hypothetical protein HT031_002819 [Scenedesmus sp. PABB004]
MLAARRAGAPAARRRGDGSAECVSRPRRRPCGARAAAGERSSLVPETLQGMAADAELQATLATLAAKGQAALTREEARARKRSLQGLGLPGFASRLSAAGLGPLVRGATTTLQLNIGLYCNQACSHCHVESSPSRTEMMDRATAQRCLQLLADSEAVSCLDITGGAPELNAQFRYLVSEARALLGSSLEIIDRCNLTVLCEPGQEDLPAFLAQHRVRVVASLPCYGADNVDKQRGNGVFERSIEGLRLLNAAGYGQPGSGLVLDLVYNPGGAFLAPPAAKLEPAYKQELQQARAPLPCFAAPRPRPPAPTRRRVVRRVVRRASSQVHGVAFNSLLCLNNMPVKRFADSLLRSGALSQYMALLVEGFNAGTVPGLMCRGTLSVAWDGRLYDCDFNQQLELPILGRPGPPPPATASASASTDGDGGGDGGDAPPRPRRKPGLTVWDIDALDDVAGLLVRTDSHCYGCTAGSGSGCQGATS